MYYNSPEQVVNGLISSGTNTMSSCQSCNHSVTPTQYKVLFEERKHQNHFEDG